MGASLYSLEKIWKESRNKPVEILGMENLIQIGILTVESNTKLPAKGFSIHEHSHEFAYIIEGNAIIGTDEGENEVKEGELLYNKPGTPHYTFNKSSKPAKILWLVTPSLKNR
ncbi:MAG: cupin domain-containing protein [Bacillota bacterium]